MRNNKTLIIIPLYNESKVIEEVVNGILKHFTNIVIINDGSTDESLDIISKLDVKVINHPFNMGQGAAIQTGIDYCIGKNFDYIVTFDGDGQHCPLDVIEMIEVINNKKVDTVLGSRFIGKTENMPKMKYILLKCAIIFNYFITGMFLTDAHNGLRVFKMNVVKNMRLKHNGMAHATEILEIISRNKLNFIEYPVTIKYTEYSISKGQSLFNSIVIAFDIIVKKFKL